MYRVLCGGSLRTVVVLFFFFFKQKTAYEMRISDWSSDVCSSDLQQAAQTKQTTQADGLAQEADDWASALAEQTAATPSPAPAVSAPATSPALNVDRKSVVWERVCQYV